jgi:hypothetical protein
MDKIDCWQYGDIQMAQGLNLYIHDIQWEINSMYNVKDVCWISLLQDVTQYK